MSDVKPSVAFLMLNGFEYPMVFNINAVDDIQDRFDAPLSEVVSMLEDETTIYKAVKGILHILIREGCEYISDLGGEAPSVPSEREVGRYISYTALESIVEQLLHCISSESPESSEDSDPNSPCELTE